MMDYKKEYLQLKRSDYPAKEFEYDRNIICCEGKPDVLFNNIEQGDYLGPIEKLSEYYSDVPYYKELLESAKHPDIQEILNKNPIRIMNNDDDINEIMLNYLMCFSDLKLGIYHDEPDIQNLNIVCIKRLALNKKETEGFVYQISDRTNRIHSLKAIMRWIVENKLSDNVNYLYVIIGREIPAKSIYDVKYSHEYFDRLRLIFNSNSINMMNYQRLDRLINFHCTYCTYIHNTYKNFITKEFTTLDIRRFMIFSMSILYSIGTTITKDLDIIIHPEVQKTDMTDKILKYCFSKDKLPFLDSCMRGYEGWIEGESKEYLFEWFDKEWPALFGAKNMIDTMFNPKFYYYFHGLKMINIEAEVQRRVKRTRPNGYVDLLALEHFNNITPKLPPLPKTTWISHKEVSIDDYFILNIAKLVQRRLKGWFNINISIDQIMAFIRGRDESNQKGGGLKELLKIDDFIDSYSLNILGAKYNRNITRRYICRSLEERYGMEVNEIDIESTPKSESTHLASYEKYTGKFDRNEDTKYIKQFNNRLKGYYLRRYIYGAKFIIDVGSGKSSDLFNFNINKIRTVVAIEPSIDSHVLAQNMYESLRKRKGRMYRTTIMIYINALGQEPWDNPSTTDQRSKENAKKLFSVPLDADAITVFHVIHYMNSTEKDFQGFLDNVKKHLKPNGYLLILCMDGEYIHNKLKESGGILDIKKNNNTIYKIEAKYDLDTDIYKDPYGNIINVYFSGVYGLTHGIDEPLFNIKYATDIMKKQNFKLIENASFLDRMDRVKNPNLLAKLGGVDYDIIRLYRALVFQYMP